MSPIQTGSEEQRFKAGVTFLVAAFPSQRALEDRLNNLFSMSARTVCSDGTREGFARSLETATRRFAAYGFELPPVAYQDNMWLVKFERAHIPESLAAMLEAEFGVEVATISTFNFTE